MRKPEFMRKEGAFGNRDIAICVGETLECDYAEEVVYFDAVCLNGTYRCQAPVGDVMKHTDYLPTWGFWRELKRSGKMRDIEVAYSFIDNDNVVHLAVL